MGEWVCDTCGTRYTGDVGGCGQRVPQCDGTVRPWTALDQYVATRALIEACDNGDRYEMSVSACCRALLFVWSTNDGVNMYSCSACNQQCGSVRLSLRAVTAQPSKDPA